MKSKKNTSYTITLELNQQEAEWLKGLVQNPIYSTESLIDAGMRQKFFSALIVEEEDEDVYDD